MWYYRIEYKIIVKMKISNFVYIEIYFKNEYYYMELNQQYLIKLLYF